MTDRLLENIIKILASENVVSFAYLFGSHAREDAGKLSDIDIAVYLRDEADAFHCRLRLIEHVVKTIGKQEIDIVVLNTAPPLLRHQVVKKGVLLKENKENRIAFEAKSLQEYFDTEYLRNTQLSYMKNQLKAGTFFG